MDNLFEPKAPLSRFRRKETVNASAMTTNADLVLRDPQDVAHDVDFTEVLQEARRKSDDFADEHRVTGDLLKLEFCI